MKKFLILILSILTGWVYGQDTVHYSGTTLSNVDYHTGELPLAVGVHNIQTMRADRGAQTTINWTYNHQPMLAYWNNKFYLEYLSNPVGEHVPPGRTLLQTSDDGYHWDVPVVLFPPYKIPDGTVKEGRTDTAHNTDAVMHQRIGFYTSKEGRLYALAFYGIVLGKKDDPNDGNGIGRVIREVRKDGSFGPICFLRYNHGFNESNTSYPFYKSSKDKALVRACDEILSSPLLMQQMVEEADRNDPLIPLRQQFKAFSYYYLPDGDVAGLWKNALTSISKDGGKTWLYHPLRAPGFVNANAKIWGQRTSDGRYVTVYNPSEFRWPLALSVSNDGLDYKNLLLVNGEITRMRYGGAYKSYGPQYVRGILPMNGTPPGGNLWVAYSMNKEDIWVSEIPVPIRDKVSSDVDDVFDDMQTGKELIEWNTFSPLLCKVNIAKLNDKKAMTLHDSDPFDYAKAERIFPDAKEITIEFAVTPAQNNHGNLEIELTNPEGLPTLRITLDSLGNVLTKQGYRNKRISTYQAGEELNVKIELDVATRFYTLTVNGKSSRNLCFNPVADVNRVVFRTGSIRRFPDADTPTDQDYDVPDANSKTKEAVYYVHYLKTKRIK